MIPEVSWSTAERVASAVSGRTPHEGSYHYRSLESDFAASTAHAEEMVCAYTRMSSGGHTARSKVLDRPAWISANVESFDRLFRSLPDSSKGSGQGIADASGGKVPMIRHVLGAEVGAVLGWMSKRVLGQYDLLVGVASPEADKELTQPAAGGVIYYVGPNVVSLEKRHGFPPRQFRLWIALHEVTHWLQFSNAPWLVDHLMSLIGKGLAFLSPDPEQLATAARRIAGEVWARKGAIGGDLGIMGLIADPDQLVVMKEIQGIMSLLEGHGNFVMNRVGSDLVSDAPEFDAVLRARRNAPPPVSKFVQRALGFDVKMRQYEQGQAFVETLERVGGPELFARVWDCPENLPSLEEVQEPLRWVTRIEASG